MSTETKHHPEQKPDEIYMGNTSIEGFLQSGWKTKRRGITPLGSNGLPLDRCSAEDLRPWFIKTDEVRASIDSGKKRQSGIEAAAIAGLEDLVERRTMTPRLH